MVLHPGRIPFLLFAIAFSDISKADTLDLGTPVVLHDELGLARDNELVTLPFPCAESAAITAPGQLRIVDPNGNEVAVQWRVLTRWYGKPDDPTKPIKFLNAMFRATLDPGASLTFTVKRRKPSDPPAPLTKAPVTVTAINGLIVVDTSAARYEIPVSPWTLFRSVSVDLNHDGIYGSTPPELVVAPGETLGPVLVDPLLGIYVGAGDPNIKVAIEEKGPLRVVLRVEGSHQPFGPGSIGRDYLKFQTRYTFTSRSTAVRVEHSLENTYLANPLGAIEVGRYTLHTKLASVGPTLVRFGGDEGTATMSPLTLPLGTEASLYQDSSGGPTWNQTGTTFSGWRLYGTLPLAIAPNAYPQTPPFAAGSQAKGWMDVSCVGHGLFTALRYPWQNYPYAMHAYFDGTALIDLVPSEFAGPQWLDDEQKKTWTLMVVPHGDSFDPNLAARTLQSPLRPRPALDYLRETKAWGDLGYLRDPKLPEEEMIAEGSKELGIFYGTLESKGGFGWPNFGEYVWAKSTHATGSPRNRLTWFDHFMTCGGNGWFERAEIFAQHSMTMRPYHIDGFKAEEHPGTILAEGVPAWPSTDMLGRDSIPASLVPYKVNIPTGGSGWNGFDGEHMTVDDIYEYYLMTGSRDALEALRQIGEAILTWKKSIDVNKPIPSTRFIGWVLRALVKIYQVTGDDRMLEQAHDVCIIADKFRGLTPSPVTGLVYNYFSREIYGGASHNMPGDYDCPWQMAVGIYGLGLYYRETSDPLALPIVHDVAQYIIDHCVQPGDVVVEAILCDDHKVINPKPKNDGVNMWITSALAYAYLVTGSEPMRALSEKIFDDNSTDFMKSGDNYHWFHIAGEILHKDP